jgi:hypothetical protein
MNSDNEVVVAPVLSHIIIKQEPSTEEAEASIPTEHMGEGSDDPDDPDLNVTVVVRRKAAKRTSPWDLAAGELILVSPPPQPEEIPAAKKPRLEEPFSASTDEAGTKISSRDTNAVSLHDDDADDDDHVDVDDNPIKGTRATGLWTPEEDAKLNSAVTKTCKKKHGKEYNWVAIAALVPGRTKGQCKNRWHGALVRRIDRANEGTGNWLEDEDIKLKDAVQTYSCKDWDAVAVLVPGRTKKQCCNRWHGALDPSIDQVSGRPGKWAEDEDSKLKDAVQTHGCKNWGAIAALVPGRTNRQCWSRWHQTLDPRINRANERTGKWAEDEDRKLKDAVQTHGGKNWVKIATLVAGRTEKQCYDRWNDVLDPSIDRVNGHKGKWTEDEDSKLKDAVHTHGGNNWAAIAALVPGRTKTQCCSRWKNLNSSIALAAIEHDTIVTN